MERNTTLDLIKFFAIVGVVIIHTKPFYGNEIGIILNSISRSAVPFFFIVSGYLFTKKFNKDISRYGKQIVKLSKLYLSWYMVYMVYDIYMLVTRNTDKTMFENIYQYAHDNLNVINIIYYASGTSGYQLWYLPTLILSIIILTVFLSVNRLTHLLIGSLILHLFGIIGESYTFIFEFWFQIREVMFFGLFYTTLGAFIAKKEKTFYTFLKAKHYLKLSLVFLLIQVVERSILISKFGESISDDYVFSTIFSSLFLFLFALLSPGIGKNSILTKVGENAVGIFVIHILVMRIGDSIFKDIEDIVGYITWNLLYTPIIVIISYLLYLLIQKSKKQIYVLRQYRK
ncbi:acyltransferase [Lederbergia wuyishanensis]|uniref:Surface polysaccharide O-acyltransferase-like enzyme n=1 Tax=Lederbergia wuyishanensis TaxID=1347903 RepID=A0ABU0D368_9BACI|nr:acyltransferase [Lederbergia wuyishanensis]MCJ8007983.1 acyltransferase [Lederbergia wuyishanensis]MDQ0342847.1 surface polysaccharide O-acyltransferase-like enzyme [Lederbergia wuyishanensis]